MSLGTCVIPHSIQISDFVSGIVHCFSSYHVYLLFYFQHTVMMFSAIWVPLIGSLCFSLEKKYGSSWKHFRIIVNTKYFKNTLIINSWQNKYVWCESLKRILSVQLFCIWDSNVTEGLVGHSLLCVHVLIQTTNLLTKVPCYLIYYTLLRLISWFWVLLCLLLISLLGVLTVVNCKFLR